MTRLQGLMNVEGGILEPLGTWWERGTGRASAQPANDVQSSQEGGAEGGGGHGEGREREEAASPVVLRLARETSWSRNHGDSSWRVMESLQPSE